MFIFNLLNNINYFEFLRGSLSTPNQFSSRLKFLLPIFVYESMVCSIRLTGGFQALILSVRERQN